MRTLVSLLHWRTLAEAFRHEAPVARVPGSIVVPSSLSVAQGGFLLVRKAERRFEADMGAVTTPARP
ncbi:MAG: hypothetical protein ACLPTZ_19730 [Beijerinckiaceae bacterium]